MYYNYSVHVHVCAFMYWNLFCFNVSFLLLFSASEALLGGPFGPGDGKVLFRNVDCFGDEPNLLDCYHSSSIGLCTHSSDAAIRCHPGGTFMIII